MSMMEQWYPSWTSTVKVRLGLAIQNLKDYKETFMYGIVRKGDDDVNLVPRSPQLFIEEKQIFYIDGHFDT